MYFCTVTLPTSKVILVNFLLSNIVFRKCMYHKILIKVHPDVLSYAVTPTKILKHKFRNAPTCFTNIFRNHALNLWKLLNFSIFFRKGIYVYFHMLHYLEKYAIISIVFLKLAFSVSIFLKNISNVFTISSREYIRNTLRLEANVNVFIIFYIKKFFFLEIIYVRRHSRIHRIAPF